MANDAPLLAVVDEDVDVRVALTRLVSSAGFAVETCAAGAEFLRSVQDHESDCVVLARDDSLITDVARRGTWSLK